jgi:tetratricopeptide (TPR) repeat protein
MADTAQPAVSEIVSRADELYDSNRMREGLTYVTQYAHLDEVEVLWRLARLCYKTGKYHTADKEESKRLAEQGWGYVERALALGGDKHNACQRWAGILLSWSSEFEGTKKKIEKSFEIRDHFVRAIECDGSDATSMHLLGQWCYSVVSVPWYQCKIASVLFATPPESTYEEALSHFEAAEKVDPEFYMVNWLWIAKCHLAMGHNPVAKPWLQKVTDFETNLEEEIEAKKEAETLLSTL